MPAPIPFSLPLIDADVIAEVHDCLTNTGWLTSGPKVQELEREISRLTGAPALCVNSWTSGATLMLRWFGVGPGDEVIVPAYTYCATALCAMNLGARAVMVDVGDDFNIDVGKLAAAISPRTKAIIPVDVGGWPCDYDELHAVVTEAQIRRRFHPESRRQEQLGRVLVLADAAHSIGATYQGKPAGRLTDVSVFSFHSVKNITTGEGGAVCLNLPAPFDNQAESAQLRALTLNGQTKSAFQKNQPGAWRYDVLDQGIKANMPDICAAIGVAQIRKYQSILLPGRRRLWDLYAEHLSRHMRFVLPPSENADKSSSCHLYMLRVDAVSEPQRDAILADLARQGVGANVHYMPLPCLTVFRERGYAIEDYPTARALYEREISLPLYNSLTEAQVLRICDALVASVAKVLAP